MRSGGSISPSGLHRKSVAPAAMAFEMPADMPEPEAAAIFMPFHLAWLALHERARLQSGDEKAHPLPAGLVSRYFEKPSAVFGWRMDRRNQNTRFAQNVSEPGNLGPSI